MNSFLRGVLIFLLLVVAFFLLGLLQRMIRHRGKSEPLTADFARFALSGANAIRKED
jgi:hypothetical protein